MCTASDRRDVWKESFALFIIFFCTCMLRNLLGSTCDASHFANYVSTLCSSIPFLHSSRSVGYSSWDFGARIAARRKCEMTIIASWWVRSHSPFRRRARNWFKTLLCWRAIEIVLTARGVKQPSLILCAHFVWQREKIGVWPFPRSSSSNDLRTRWMRFNNAFPLILTVPPLFLDLMWS